MKVKQNIGIRRKQRERLGGWDGWEREEGQMERAPEPTAELSG